MGAALGATLGLGRLARRGTAVQARPLPWEGRRPNLLLLFTDQERSVQHWPAGWAERNLPSFPRLKRQGLTFRNAFTASSECTPSRATLLTGSYPSVNGVTTTFDPLHGLSGTGVTLQTFQQNLGKLMARAGYRVVYKGKWHLSLPVGTDWTERDIAYLAERYGFPGWNPPDAGTSLSNVTTAGGGTANNDGRYVAGMTPGAAGQVPGYGESVLDFLDHWQPSDPPFCLFVALANPHDIGFYPNVVDQAGYRREDFAGLGIDLPDNFADPLDTKPTVQRLWRAGFDGYAPLNDPQAQHDYVNFYAYLHTWADREILRILDALDARGLTEDTLIFRFADHGEMGLSHGLRQKMFAAYEELIHLPLIVSNPRLFPAALETDALASLVDFVPTLAALAGIPRATVESLGCHGADLGPVLADPAARVQDAVLFTYDDGATLSSLVGAFPADTPTHIRCLREENWKYAVYFTVDGMALEYELYDLRRDPGELENLAFEPSRPGTSLDAERQRLHRALTERLVATEALPLGFTWPARSGPASAA